MASNTNNQIKVPPFCALKGESVVFNQDGVFKFFVPEKMFENKLCVLEGELANLFGLIGYAVYDKNGKVTKTYTQFNYPASFHSKPDSIEIAKNLKLTKNSKEQDYRILLYHKDAPIVLNYWLAESNADLALFYKALQYGSIPNEIPYNELQNYFLDNITITGAGYDVGLQVIGLVISELCRSQDHIEVPFRLSKEKDYTKYQSVNIREIPRVSSPFAAITSEMWDDAVINAITVKSNKKSPMEKIMMG